MASNDWFDNSTLSPFPKGGKARAEAVDAKFNAITTGFDKFPSEVNTNQGTHNYAGTSGGAAGAYTATLTHVTVAYVDGQELEFIANHSNPAGGTSVNVSAVGDIGVVLADGSALPANAIIEDGTYRFKYNAILAKWILNTGAATALTTGAAITTTQLDPGGYFTDPGGGKQVEAALQELGPSKITIGTFTPTIYGSTTPGNPTGTFAGSYIAFNGWVFLNLSIVLTAIGGMVGAIRIGDLPFTISNSPLVLPVASLAVDSVTIAAGESHLTATGRLNEAALNLVYSDTGTGGGLTTLNEAKIANNSGFHLSMNYKK